MQRCHVFVGLVTSMVALAACGERLNAAEAQPEYPQTRRVAHQDTYFSVKVPDPYRWLEDDVRKSKEVADWVSAENRVTSRYLESIPERAAIRRRLTELWLIA